MFIVSLITILKLISSHFRLTNQDSKQVYEKPGKPSALESRTQYSIAILVKCTSQKYSTAF